MAAKRYDVDLTKGPIINKLLHFALPVAVGHMLQVSFDAADIAVVGRFSDYGALSVAGIGATNSITNFLVTMVWGLSGGTNALASRYYGAKDNRRLSRTLHTSIALGFLTGIIMTIIGVVFAAPLLRVTNTPAEIFGKAHTYLVLRFAGILPLMLLAFGCAQMRATGDTKRPFYYLVSAGAINLVLNIFFVVVCKLDVAGVSIATTLAKSIAAVMVIQALRHNHGACRLFLKKIHIYKEEFKQILWIGVPTGIQSSCFSASNVIIQATINTFGAAAIAGTTAATQIEAIIHAVTFSMYMAAMAFTGQNFGAKKYHRAVRGITACITTTAVLVFSSCILSNIFDDSLLALFINSSEDPQAIKMGIIKIQIIFTTYYLAGSMDVISSSLRAIGKSVPPMLVSILCVCGLRVVWILWIFPMLGSFESIYVSYPITWLAVLAINGGMLYYYLKKLIYGEAGQKSLIPVK